MLVVSDLFISSRSFPFAITCQWLLGLRAPAPPASHQSISHLQHHLATRVPCMLLPANMAIGHSPLLRSFPTYSSVVCSNSVLIEMCATRGRIAWVDALYSI
jgi:hypothetical protein